MNFVVDINDIDQILMAKRGAKTMDFNTAIEWEDEPVEITEFYRRFPLPHIVKLYSGDYGNFGMGTSIDIAKPFLLYTSRRCAKVLAANLKWNNDKKEYHEIGNKVVIPVNYPGWFQFLDDSGKVAKPLKTIGDVVQTKAQSFFAKTSITCFIRSTKAKTGERVYMRRTMPKGEVYTIGDVFVENVETGKGPCCINWILYGFHRNTREVKYLQCFDPFGKELLVEFSYKGEFLPVGKRGSSISEAAYQLTDVAHYHDLPIHMAVVHGDPPSTECGFTGIVQIEDVYFDETIIACSLGDPDLVLMEFPLDSGVGFLKAKNVEAIDQVGHMIRPALEYCDSNVDFFMNRMKVVQSFYPEHVPMDESGTIQFVQERQLPPLPSPYVLKKEEDTRDNDSHISSATTFSEGSDFGNEQVDAPPPPEEEHNSHYEVIPAHTETDIDTQKHTLNKIILTRHHSIATTTQEPAENHDEEGYLVPMELRQENNESIPCNKKNDNVVIPSVPKHPPKVSPPLITKFLNRRDSSCQVDLGPITCTTIPLNGTADQTRPVSPPDGIAENQVLHKSEQMNRFLKDSVEQLDRMKNCKEVERNEHVENEEATIMNSKEDFQAYLDQIFDCDSMISEQYQTNTQKRRASSSDIRHQLNPNCDKESSPFDVVSWGGFQNRSKKPSYKFSLSEPNATLRRHNLNKLIPRPHPEGKPTIHDDCGFNNSSGIQVVNVNYDNETSDYNTGQGRPPSPTESSLYKMRHGYIPSDNDGPPRYAQRTDSGIFMGHQWSLNESRGENESLYRAFGSDYSNSWSPPGDLSNMTVSEVARSLHFIGTKDYIICRFMDEQIDGKQFVELNDELIKEGFPELNSLERKKVVDFIGGWRPKLG